MKFYADFNRLDAFIQSAIFGALWALMIFLQLYAAARNQTNYMNIRTQIELLQTQQTSDHDALMAEAVRVREFINEHEGMLSGQRIADRLKD